MRRLERADDSNEALMVALRGHQATVWTALPGIILSFNAAKMTAEVQPAMQALLASSELVQSWVTLPPLVDCPVVFPSGGGFTLTFPVKVGDECLVVFASRCIDSWWQQGGVPQPAEIRLHDLSDGFVLVGPRSIPRVLPSVSTTDVVLRSDDGTARVAIKANKNIDLTTTGDITLNAANVTIVGNVAITGTLTDNGKDVGSTHRHSGVQAGGANTGVPT